MPVYENPDTGIRHWVSDIHSIEPRVACGVFPSLNAVWGWGDLVGEPADVTCRKCQKTSEFLNAIQDAN